jgi:hypothetical protein
MGLGTGAGAIPLWYGRIDRYFFTNDVANKFNNWMLDVTPLQPPRSNIWNNYDNGVNKWYGVSDLTVNIWGDDRKAFATALNEWYAYDLERERKVGEFLRITDGETLEWAENVGIAEDVGGELFNEDHLGFFYVGLSFIYDGYQESQITLATKADVYSRLGVITNKSWIVKANATDPQPIAIGWARNNANQIIYQSQFLFLSLKLRKTDVYDVDGNNYPVRTNPRITAVRAWLGMVSSATQKPEDVPFFPVKTITVSGKEEFKDILEDGTKTWIQQNGVINNNADYVYMGMPIGANDWIEGLKAGDYAKINGHPYVIPDTKYGLQKSPFLEGYKYAQVAKDRVFYGGVRWGGEVKPNHVLRDATYTEQGGGDDTPDVTDGIPFQFSSDVMGLSKLDEDTLVVAQLAAVDKRSVPDMVKLNSSPGGCTAHDSIMQIGNYIMFYRDGELYLYDGVNEPRVISDPIARDSDDGVYKGLNSTYDDTNVWSMFLPALRKQVIICKYSSNQWHVFVYDVRVKKWVEFKFAHICQSIGDPAVVKQFVACCRGVDGEFDFTDGIYIYRYPVGLEDAGQAISPVYQYSDVELPAHIELALNDLYVNHKTQISTLDVTVRRDRGELSAVVKALSSASGSDRLLKVTQPFDLGTRVKKSVSVKFSLTTPTTTSLLHVENVRIDATEQESV